MAKKWRGIKITKVRLRYAALALVLAVVGFYQPKADSSALKCPDVKFVFARGSGGERWTDQNYLAFKSSIEEKVAGLGLQYEFTDLDYPAVAIDNFSVITGAFFGAGEAYEFGRSVDEGVESLVKMINRDSCKKTKYVLGGYSQGAMVVSKALRSLDADKIIYAATFGDPKLFLPEGKSWLALGFGSNSGKNFLRTGTIPAACKNENLSEYRKYVPDCYAYEGLLGSYQPYQPATFAGKVGTWCNKTDVFCSSYFSIESHLAYVSDGLYDDASKVILEKVAKDFGIDTDYASLHNTVIMLDSSKSMQSMIAMYKNEALRLAEKTLASGGKVALYDYKDYSDGEERFLTKHCDFATCTKELIEQELNSITAKNYFNIDWRESTLAASWRVMKELQWEQGATKSFVVLTDAGLHRPDKDGTTYESVVKLSREIDPVNFYFVTSARAASEYETLAADTDGQVVIIGEGEVELTDQIMARYDSLPRVEVEDDFAELPDIAITEVVDQGASVRLTIEKSGARALVVLNDAVIGVTDDDALEIHGLDRSLTNTIKVVALSETRRGWSDEVTLGTMSVAPSAVPLTPNTGRH